MWPFGKRRTDPDHHEWLSVAEAQRVVRIHYRDKDEGCWLASAEFENTDPALALAIATPSKEEAIELAQSLAKEVLEKSGRVVPIVAL
jgi:hypothetical protein